jgi:trimeric autotransporter adhesin
MSDATSPPTTPQGAVAAPAIQESADKAALDKAAELASKRQEANATLAACGVAYAQGERAMRAGRFEAGRLAGVYVCQRMALGDKRDAAVSAIEGELAKWSSERPDASVLIRCYHAYRLLVQENPAADKTAADSVPYGHYREAFCQLLERTGKDTAAESWQLLTGCEDKARTLFGECAANALSREACKERVYSLQREYADKLAADKTAAAELAKGKAAEEQKAADKAKADAKAAQKALKDAEKAAEKAAEEQKAALTAAAEKAKQELLAKQKAALEADKLAREAQKAANALAAEKAAAEKAAQKAADKTEPKAPAANKTAPASNTPPIHNPVAAAKSAQPKDLAANLVAQIAANKAPGAVLEELARLWKWAEKDGINFARGMLDNEHRGAQDAALALCIHIQENLEEQTGANTAAAA